MLKINPVARPDCSSILKKIEKLSKVPPVTKLADPSERVSDHNLLGTIAIPHDLRNLENVLPEAKYDNQRLMNRNDSLPKVIKQEPKHNESSKFGLSSA